MAISRYSNTTKLAVGSRYGTSNYTVLIRDAIANGQLSYRTAVPASGQRLDTVAGQQYGDGSLWWVIAAASNIGWASQVPAGTVLVVPTSLTEIERVLAI